MYQGSTFSCENCHDCLNFKAIPVNVACSRKFEQDPQIFLCNFFLDEKLKDKLTRAHLPKESETTLLSLSLLLPSCLHMIPPFAKATKSLNLYTCNLNIVFVS